MTIENAATNHPILKLLAERWSPYGFEDRPVSKAEIFAPGHQSLQRAALRWEPLAELLLSYGRTRLISAFGRRETGQAKNA